MIENCPYCTPTTGGHSYNCPNNPSHQMGRLEVLSPTLGWECPKCGNVYAPSVAKCETCSNRPPWGTIYITTNLEDTVKPE